MNRSDFQQLSDIRLREARALLAAGFPAGAFYLAGYAVECALKACIAKKVQQHDFPDKDTVLQSYSHNLVNLLKVAGLEPVLDAAMKGDINLAANWAIVKDWKEDRRYNASTVSTDTKQLIDAVGDPTSGVLQWLIQRW